MLETVDESFAQLIEISEKLSRRNRLTPKPSVDGVCGHTVEALFATLTYRCSCGSPRLKVVSAIVGASVDGTPAVCLRCGSNETTFEKLEFHSR